MMAPELQLAAAVAGIVVSGPFIIASVKAIFFFGQMSKALAAANATIARVEGNVDTFIAKAESLLSDHSERLLAIEVDRAAEQKYGRRMRDAHVATDNEAHPS